MSELLVMSTVMNKQQRVKELLSNLAAIDVNIRGIILNCMKNRDGNIRKLAGARGLISAEEALGAMLVGRVRVIRKLKRLMCG